MKCNKCGQTAPSINDIIDVWKGEWMCACLKPKLVYRPPTEKDVASEKYKRAQEICAKEQLILTRFEE